MTGGQPDNPEVATTADWPTFELTYTYNPTELSIPLDLGPDELVVFCPTTDGTIDESWITAERGSYVPIEDLR